ncbi:hypothetical protein PAGA_b0351 [Pseudoalteromonas agarivorans DSM 14585]|uniref:Uncharacterized protein n=1 Tax=Pseudoalteromonas agarivorans DSM 14585 TaxID=1312369 RepID=A0ACA8E1V1_9GAMM|nr:hypothetical protein PAGA_b0351 [Pseudoalteromonas agarivorans DSM 14585]ETJ48215.1 hypothetical protein X564_10860 [Pseudoalteromonas agarivorans]
MQTFAIFICKLFMNYICRNIERKSLGMAFLACEASQKKLIMLYCQLVTLNIS